MPEQIFARRIAPEKANVAIVGIWVVRIEEHNVPLTSQATAQQLINRVEISHVRARIDSVAVPTISVNAAALPGPPLQGEWLCSAANGS